MERLTTDNPSGNFETMLNFVHGKDGWAHVYDADGKEVNLITWALNHCHDRGCDDFQCETLEEYDEALCSCMMDYMDCSVAMAYCFGNQAVHLRSRLKMYEDAMPLERVQELAQAEKDGRLVVLPFVAMVEQSLQNGKMTPKQDQRFNGRYAVVYVDKKKWASPLIDICGKHYDREEAEKRLVELTREEADAALKKREAENEAD